MPPKSKMPSCGFAVGATKKGELQLKVEKRARGKKVTIIPNVTGDASRLARALQTMLGVGGTARQAEKGFWSVEVQGDQTQRVTKALLDFECLQGLSHSALEALQGGSNLRTDSVVSRNAATKFLEQTQAGGALSPAEERRKMLEMEADFYGQYWEISGNVKDDFSDIWDETLSGMEPGQIVADHGPSKVQSLPELNISLMALGMIAECGRAVKEFWETSGMTVQQFRKMALNPGARLVDEGPGRRIVSSNLRSRQKLSDFRTGGARVNYFSCTCSVIDDYQRGKVRTREEREAEQAESKVPEPEVPRMVVTADEEGWCVAALSYCAPFPLPRSRLPEEERMDVAKRALRELEDAINGDLAGISVNVPGVACRLDCDTFGLDLSLYERDFGRRDSGKPPTQQDKEELKLEKKLREICALRRREVEGEKLEKLQAEKVARRGELFEQVAEMKLRRAEKDLLKVFKRFLQRFQDAFWDLEFKALYSDASNGTSNVSTQPAFGIFDEANRDKSVTLSSDCSRAESRSPEWVGARLLLGIHNGEVGAFAVEVVEGLVRVGWVAEGAAVGDLGGSRGSYGFGGTGRKATGGTFEPYGRPFGPGDVIHCEAEREDGRLRIGFAKNNEPLGVAFDVDDTLGPGALMGAVCGKGFKVRLVSAECLPLDEAPPLPSFEEYDPPRMAVALRDFRSDAEDCLSVWAGETVNVSSADGEGWLFGFFLDPEDPDDGGWLPADAVRFLDEAEGGPAEEDNDGWGAPPVADIPDLPPFVPSQASASAPSAPQARTPAAVVTPAISAVASEGDGPVPGLAQWLQSLSLQKYEAQAAAWCHDMGAVSMDEVLEVWEELADALVLKPLERKRLAKAVTK